MITSVKKEELWQKLWKKLWEKLWKSYEKNYEKSYEKSDEMREHERKRLNEEGKQRRKHKISSIMIGRKRCYNGRKYESLIWLIWSDQTGAIYYEEK